VISKTQLLIFAMLAFGLFMACGSVGLSFEKPPDHSTALSVSLIGALAILNGTVLTFMNIRLKAIEKKKETGQKE